MIFILFLIRSVISDCSLCATCQNSICYSCVANAYLVSSLSTNNPQPSGVKNT